MLGFWDMQRKRILIASAVIVFILILFWLGYNLVSFRATLKETSEPVSGDLVIAVPTWMLLLLLLVAVVAVIIHWKVRRKRT